MRPSTFRDVRSRPLFRLFRQACLAAVSALCLVSGSHAAALPTSSVSPSADGLQGVPSRMLRPLAGVEATYRDQVISEDTVWRGVIVLEGSVTVAPQATLTIRPGTVVVARSAEPGVLGDTSLFVLGRLVVQGDAERRVQFTSAFAAPQPGDWFGIILQGSEKKNQLDNCRIEGAERGIEAHFSNFVATGTTFAHCRIALRLLDSLATLRGMTISDSPIGVMIQAGETDLREGNISGGKTGIAVEAGSVTLGQVTVQGGEIGLEAEGARLQIRGGVFAGNGNGMRLSACEGEIVGTRVVDNREGGVRLRRSRLKVHGNEIAGNGTVGVHLADDLASFWGNVIQKNGAVELSYDGSGDLAVPGNWWGGLPLPELKKKVVVRHVADPPARVLLTPVLAAPPSLPF